MTIGVGVIGYGFMGRTHAASYLEAQALGLDCELRAIATRDPRGASDTAGTLRTGNIEGTDAGSQLPASVRFVTEPSEVFAAEDIDVVSICTPTDSHVELAVAALEAGKHVLIEKPVALSVARMEPLLIAASATDRMCMPAHCMRFWPGWPEAREYVLNGMLGKVTSAEFRRIGQPPAWNTEFYLDRNRSGGPLFDLHIHDADFILWTFGQPADVRCTGSLDHFKTEYVYVDDVVVRAEGGWIRDPDVAFEMKFRITFELGSLDFSYDRQPALLLTTGGLRTTVPLAGPGAYAAQAIHMIKLILGVDSAMRVSLPDAVAVTRLLQQEAGVLTQ